MKERFVFGYFQTPDAAQKAAEELKARGFEAYVDRFDPMGGGRGYEDHEVHNPFIDQKMSLSESTVGTPPANDDKRILLSAHPDASGLAGGNGFEKQEDHSVTVFCQAEQMEEVRQILKRHGARD
ncbi:SPOR domain-containing protein [Staphylospora marina]|uniref:SPOR domain-containing protein n=1 Tax=Staphylospora marina TaxID=2490858 RepID=UPI000F5BC251|nr:hypothetical protein [Staphylospora marina]